ncbi:MAG TPA: GNAT family N-acetyltransferase, partial [bacterium]
MSGPRIPDSNATSWEWQRHPGDIAVLPVGATEQHAKHLPLATDTIQAEYFARHLAEALGAALLPAIPVSTSLEHKGFRGTLTLRPATLTAVVNDLAGELEAQGFRRLIVLNGHGGNFILNPALREWNRANRALKLLLVNFWECADPGIVTAPEIHAGEFETSIMLAIAPHLVGPERVDFAPPDADPAVRQSDLTHFGVGRFSPNGVWGYPSRATVETGQRLVASIRASLAPHVRKRLDWLAQDARYEGLGPVELRPMHAGDIAAGLQLCRAAGWNQVAADWQLYLAQNPTGCSVLVRGGEVAGTVITVDYQGRFGWVGMVLVRPELRGAGIGTRLLHVSFDHLRACETVKLDATPAGRQIYLPLGFVDEYGLMRMEAVSAGDYGSPKHAVRPLREADLPAVFALDEPVFGARRETVLRAYWHAAPHLAHVVEQGGKVVAFAVGRRGHTHDHVGAIVAPERDMAADLVRAALAGHPGQRFLADAMVHDPLWLRWLKEAGFREQRPYTRMVKG